MFWQEEINEEKFSVPDGVQDCVFSIKAKQLPVDHLNAVAQGLLAKLPWLETSGASIHDINIVDGNGWIAPKAQDAFFYPSKRSKLSIRLPKKYLEKIDDLVGETIDCNGFMLTITKRHSNKKLSDSTILFARYLYTQSNDSEEEFLEKTHNALGEIGVMPKKMLAGLNHTITTNNGIINTRSLMLADLSKAQSYQLQAHGIGDYRLLGCGLFLPQKGIDSVAAV